MSSTLNDQKNIEIIFPELINDNKLELEEDTKCAEIYSTKESNFYIVCTYCKAKFFKLKPFAIHVRENHFKQYALKVHNFKNSKNEPQNLKKQLTTTTPKVNSTDNTASIKGQNIVTIENEMIVSSEDEDFKDNELSVTSINQNKKLISSASKINNNIISKPRIKIVIKKGQYFTPVKRKTASTKYNDKLANHIKCGFGNCKQMFRNQDDLDKHKTELHSTDPNCPYKCKDCNKIFKRTSNLFTHIRRFHLRERNFKCDYCDKEFFEKTCKLKHELIHTGEKPCICEKCGERFQVTHKLNMHVKSKHEMPQLECKVCRKLFHNKENLTLHMICHSSEQPFECNVCLKRFPRKRSLLKHLTTHATDRDFVCRLCGKDFTSQIRISCHMKSHGIPYREINVLRKSKEEEYVPYEIKNCTA